VGADDVGRGREGAQVLDHGVAGLRDVSEPALDQADARQQPHERRLREVRWGAGLTRGLAAAPGGGLGVVQAAGEQSPRRIQKADGPL
jgi:hypothetical protein